MRTTLSPFAAAPSGRVCRPFRLVIGLCTILALLAGSGVGDAAAQADTGGATLLVGLCPAGVPIANLDADPGSAGPLCGTDPSIDPVPKSGLLVIMHALDLGFVFSATTGVDGRVEFSSLPAATYTASFERGLDAATRCSVGEPAGALRDVVNIAAIDVPLASGETLDCAVALGNSDNAGNAGFLDSGGLADAGDLDIRFITDDEVDPDVIGDVAGTDDVDESADGLGTPDAGPLADTDDLDRFEDEAVSGEPVDGADTDGSDQVLDEDGTEAAEDEGSVEIVLTVVQCPDELAVANLRIKPLAEGRLCEDPDAEPHPLGDVEVLVEDIGRQIEETTFTDAESGVAEFTMPPGRYFVTFPEFAPDELGVAGRCVISTVDDPEADIVNIAYTPANLQEDGASMACAVALGSLPDLESPDPDAAEENGDLAAGEISILSYTCTPGDDTDLRDDLIASADPDVAVAATGLGLDQLHQVCSEEAQGATSYTVNGAAPDDVDDPAENADDAADSPTSTAPLLWAGLENGLYTIEADVPDRDGTPIVICTVEFLIEGVQTNLTNRVVAEDGVIEIELDVETVRVACEWFNVDLESPIAEEGGSDGDADGLSDEDESFYGTDPLIPDSDADGTADGDEVSNGTDPTFADAVASEEGDPDFDGLTTAAEESDYFTDPANADTDADGLGDGDEVMSIGTDPANPDSDADGVTDGDEVSAGTDPNDEASL